MFCFCSACSHLWSVFLCLHSSLSLSRPTLLPSLCSLSSSFLRRCCKLDVTRCFVYRRRHTRPPKSITNQRSIYGEALHENITQPIIGKPDELLVYKAPLHRKSSDL